MSRSNVLYQRVSSRKLFTSKEQVLAKAREFDSNLRVFLSEIRSNPVFRDLLFTKMPHAEKVRHEAFATSYAALDDDWNGSGEKDDPGYYKGLKSQWVVDGTDYEDVERFEERLSQLMSDYEALGYKVIIRPAPPKEDGSGGLGGVEKSLTNIVYLVGIGFALYVGFLYVVPALLGAATATRRSTRELRSA